MWKIVSGRLVPVTDTTRKRVKTYIDATKLTDLQILANQHHTHISYLIENGLLHLLANQPSILRSSKASKQEVRITCDEEILSQAKAFAKLKSAPLTVIIDASIACIQPEEVIKKRSWRHRVEP